MFYVVNAMNILDNSAKIISAHRTAEAAERATLKFDRAVTRRNGQGSYVPTRIVECPMSRIDHGWAPLH